MILGHPRLAADRDPARDITLSHPGKVDSELPTDPRRSDETARAGATGHSDHRLSADNHAHIEQAMREAGAAAFHTKEATVDQLYQTIQQVLISTR